MILIFSLKYRYLYLLDLVSFDVHVRNMDTGSSMIPPFYDIKVILVSKQKVRSKRISVLVVTRGSEHGGLGLDVLHVAKRQTIVVPVMGFLVPGMILMEGFPFKDMVICKRERLDESPGLVWTFKSTIDGYSSVGIATGDDVGTIGWHGTRNCGREYFNAGPEFSLFTYCTFVSDWALAAELDLWFLTVFYTGSSVHTRLTSTATIVTCTRCRMNHVGFLRKKATF